MKCEWREDRVSERESRVRESKERETESEGEIDR